MIECKTEQLYVPWAYQLEKASQSQGSDAELSSPRNLQRSLEVDPRWQ